MHWYRRAWRHWGADREEMVEEEAQPLLDAGVIDEDLPEDEEFEPDTYHVPGTDIVISADDDPSGEYPFEWLVISPEGIEDSGYPGDLGELARKWATKKKEPHPEPGPPVDASKRLEEIKSQLYGIGNPNDPRAKPLLEEYKRLTGKDKPGFMA